MKKLLLLCLFLSLCATRTFAQNNNTNVNNNSVTVIINNQPTVKKTVKKEKTKKKKTEVVNKKKQPKPKPKRVARKLSAPVQLQGYLWVYPEDIGHYSDVPKTIIENINLQKRYGRDYWRVPTKEEMNLMENYANTIGLGSDKYAYTYWINLGAPFGRTDMFSSGNLRLVSTGPVIDEQTKIRETIISSGQGRLIGNTIWSTQIFTDGPDETFSRREAMRIFPEGWRLPNANEVVALIKYNDNDPIKTWQFLKELTSTDLKIVKSGSYQVRGYVREYEINEGYLIYMGKEGPTTVGFYLGTDSSRTKIQYNEEGHYGYIVLVYDGM